MDTNYAYLKLMEEKKLTLAELPADAKIGIESIAKIARAIDMAEKGNKKVSDSVIAKLKANDKWVVREILDYLEEKNTNTPAVPNKAEEVIKEINDPKDKKVETNNTPTAADEKGIAIDAELKKVLESGKSELKLDELKTAAPKAYAVIFETYKAGEENGIETSYYTLIETSDKVFTLKAK